MKKKMTYCLFLLLLSCSLTAQITTFTGTGNWTDPARWNPTVPGTEVTNLTVVIEGSCTLSSEIDIESTAVLRIANGGTLNIDGDDDNTPELDINGGMLIIESGGVLNQPRSFVRISQSINNDVVVGGTYNHSGGDLAFQINSENMVINGGSYICTGGTSKLREVIVNGSGTFSNAITLSTKDITLNGTAQLINTGTLNFTDNDKLTLNDNAVLTNNGVINLNQSNDFLENAANTRIQGTGTFNLSEPFFNNGTIAPGNSIGDITFNGDLTIAAGSSLEIEITGTSGDSDVLIINGSLTIESGATLDVSLISGILDMGDHYDIITWTTVSGLFSTTNLPGLLSDWAKPTYGATALNIEYTSSTPYSRSNCLPFAASK
jgi:fibronectin-binding autotransporter adhesin